MAEKSLESGHEESQAVHSVFCERQKRFSIVITSLVSFLTPASASIYYPALGSLAEDLDVSRSDINLTITAFMIVQSVIPLFTGSISDRKGRRPVLRACLSIYLGVNIGLALQTSFPALMTLRCFQSIGSNETTVVVIATTSDLIDAVGIGWVGTIIAGFWCLISLPLWLLYIYGHEWRKIGDV